MHRFRIVLLAAVVLAALLPAPAGAAAPKSRADEAPGTGEIIVKYRGGADRASIRSQAAAKLAERLPLPNTEVLTAEGSVSKAIAALERNPNVEYAEPNHVYSANAVTPDDPRFGALWGLGKIAAQDAWTVTTGSPEVTIGVVDSGVALAHPDLAPNIWANPGESGSGKETNGVDDDGNGLVDDWRGWDWIDGDNRPGDAHGHGSHVAGTIAARGNDGYGIAGVNWNAGIVPLRALDSTGVGTTADIAAAFFYAGQMGIDVVNASLGGSGYSTTLLQAIEGAPNTLFVVAAGNDGTNNDLQPQYPCNFPSPNLICVAASDSNDALASFSNHGTLSVDLAAPGVGILSTAPKKSAPFTETFETDLSSRWTSGGANNLWARGIDIHGGYLSDSLGINYLNDTDSWAATANAFSLSKQSDCKLHYDLRLDVEKSKDSLTIEMSRDGEDWSKIAGWTGSSNGSWRAMTEDASAFDGAGSAYLRFRLRSDSSTTGAGADIDNVRVRCLSDEYSGNEYTTASGTSMATPHVAGVAALLKAAVPGATPAQIASATLAGVDPVLGLAGKVATGGRLNAAGALVHLTGSPVGGDSDPAPEPEPEATVEPEPLPTIEPEPIEPDPEPSPEPAPEPEPTVGVGEEHPRHIGLRLKRSLFAVGRIHVETGYQPCAIAAPVKIKRNGKVIRKVTTNDYGFYRARIPNRRGRYIAKAVRFVAPNAVPEQVCLADRSPLRRRR